MSILVDKNTRVICQGFTGAQGTFHSEQAIAYGTRMVGGVTPGKGGTTHLGLPVFDTVREAIEATGADASAVYVPPAFAGDAILEAIDAGVAIVVCVTEGVPVLDMVKVKRALCGSDTRLIGPNCPGIITPGETSLGMYPPSTAMPGPVGVASRSGTLCFEVTKLLCESGIGQTSCVGIGGDPVIGKNFVEYLKKFEADPETKSVVMIGELGGNQEENAAEFIRTMSKPVVAFISGKSAPPEKRMGHAGAISSQGSGAALDKVKVLEDAGVRMADTLVDIVRLTSEALAR